MDARAHAEPTGDNQGGFPIIPAQALVTVFAATCPECPNVWVASVAGEGLPDWLDCPECGCGVAFPDPRFNGLIVRGGVVAAIESPNATVAAARE